MAEEQDSERESTEEASEREEGSSEEQASEQDSKQKTQDAPPEVKAALTKANKEAEKLRRKLKEYEDRDKSETQKLTDDKVEAERAATEARIAYLRLKVGTTKGLAPDLAERLHGDTEEEMEADADRLLAALPKPKTTGSADGGPRGTGKTGTVDEQFGNAILERLK